MPKHFDPNWLFLIASLLFVAGTILNLIGGK